MPDARVQSAIAHWAPRFVSNGVPLTDFEEVTAGVERWEDWCKAWSARGAIHEEIGRKVLAGGHRLSAGEHLTRAAVCYHFSKFVFVVDYDQMKAAHKKAVECRNLALPLLDPPGERVAIPYEGKQLYGNLRKPKGAVRPPVVIMCMGLDSAKEEMDSNENVFLARGMATLTFDGPGQGEGEYDFAIRGDYEAAVKAVADFIETRSDLDAGRIGLWGVSLGGYYAPRAAAYEKRVKACIALSGPFDWADFFDKLPPLTRDTFRVRSKSKNDDEARRHAATLTLKQAAKSITCPLFVMMGKQDALVPWQEGEKLAAAASGPVVRCFIEDGNHVANNRVYRYRPQSADWMAERLDADGGWRMARQNKEEAMNIGSRLLAVLVAVLGVAGTAAAAEQKYPVRPVRMLVPFPAGSASDFLARVVSTRMSEVYGQQMVVDNRPGAGGLIGSQIVAKSAPDGYTISMIGQPQLSNTLMRDPHPYDPLKDYDSVTLVAIIPNVIVLGNGVPAANVTELIALAKAKPGQLNFGSAGIGSSSHLAGEMLVGAAGIKAVHVPFKTISDIFAEMIAGRVHFYVFPMPAVMPMLKEGRLKPLAVATKKRAPALPNVPTTAEAGFGQYLSESWFGVVTPAGVSKQLIGKLNADITRMLQEPATRDRFQQQGAESSPSTPEQFHALQKEEYERLGKLIKDLGIKVQ